MATTPQYPVDYDPFAEAQKFPAVSWANAPVGTVVTGVISRLPKELQDVDYATKLPKTWPDGQPQMTVVTCIDITLPSGAVETRGLWAKKPSSMFVALGKAQQDSGTRFAIGGTLQVRFTGTQPAKKPGMHPQKLFEARYSPPASTGPDPWAPPAQTPQPPPSSAPGWVPQAVPASTVPPWVPQTPPPAPKAPVRPTPSGQKVHW